MKTLLLIMLIIVIIAVGFVVKSSVFFTMIKNKLDKTGKQ